MLQSMTAFGSRQFEFNDCLFSWEIKTVNHRYLDVSIRLPEHFATLEIALRQIIKKFFFRGKVDCVLKIHSSDHKQTLSLNQSLVHSLMRLSDALPSDYAKEIDKKIPLMDLFSWPGVVERNQLLLDEQMFLEPLEKLVAHVQTQREEEGHQLAGFLLEKIDYIVKIINEIESLSPSLIQNSEKRLRERLSLLENTIDENRLQQELVYLAQRIDIEEEISRIKAHLKKVTALVNSDQSILGKSLDFYMQELNREANTLCSKSQSSLLTHHGVDLKVVIEQMREQIQNIQ